MQQLTQNLKSGKMEITEVPTPALTKNNVLVRNHFSMISAGTEGDKVNTARKGLIGKAKEKPDQVMQVLDTLKKEGFSSTYKKVMNKLDALSPLGYSTSGVVEAVGENVRLLKVGDRVACGGADIANHADMVSIPENLVVKIPDNVNLEDAAYTTVASIAMQGVRQADLRLGESCAIIGLGLLGQLTIQMLKASGVKVIGIDIDKDMVKLAKKSGADLSFERNSEEIEQAALNLSDGYGVDAVIITAGTSSLDPVELSGKICRVKGKVVIVGAVPTGFSRAKYFRKELELRMSTSYGPGRYNPNYEEKGMDYPIGYVRWTENRNMQAYIQLVSEKKINLDFLTTHIFDFQKASEAYQLIVDRSELFVGLLLRYDTEKEIKKEIVLKKTKPASSNNGDLKVSFIGAGSFAQNSLLPNIPKSDAEFISVATSQGHTSKNVADKYGFAKSTCDANSITDDKETDTVFIATRHDSHAEYTLSSIKNGKNVFVEKPLCMNEEELEEIREEYNKQDLHLMVGFNRRFAPHIRKIKQMFSKEPKSMNYRINSGNIPSDVWIQDKEIGGGRIIGEVCHFVDLVMFLAGSLPENLSANAIIDPLGLLDTLNVNIKFKDGSIANVSYFSNGSKELKKEYLEVFSNGQTAIVDDFKELVVYGSKKNKYKLMNQDKGHKVEVQRFVDAIKKGKSTPISFEDIYWSTKMSFDIIKSIQTGETIKYS